MEGIVQTINVSATLKAMEVGASVFFGSEVCENTIRNTAVRLKKLKAGAWEVDKRRNPVGFIVTRTA